MQASQLFQRCYTPATTVTVHEHVETLNLLCYTNDRAHSFVHAGHHLHSRVVGLMHLDIAIPEPLCPRSAERIAGAAGTRCWGDLWQKAN